jgi:hypothetical protein
MSRGDMSYNAPLFCRPERPRIMIKKVVAAGDLLYVYPDAIAKSYKAIYFDNEGHVIHYEVSTVN